MRRTHLSHQFVEFIPEQLEDGILYISQRYGTATHTCCCGCGMEVNTPLTPTDWSIRINDNTVTLYPSIGNWSFPCRSHYWIRRSNVIWAGAMSQQQIERGRAIDRATKEAYFESVNHDKVTQQVMSSNDLTDQLEKPELVHRLLRRLRGWWKSQIAMLFQYAREKCLGAFSRLNHRRHKRT